MSRRLPALVLLAMAEIGSGLALASAPSQTGPAASTKPKSAQRPSRDTRQARVGTGQVAGRVTAADSAAPLRQAEVVLSSSTLGAQKRAVSDATGQFRFTALPAGRYWIRGGRPGFVTLRYGATDPLETGRPIDLAEGSAITDINLVLPRAAVISGQVVDEFGEPVLDAEVRALRYRNQSGQRRLVAASRIRMTDDLGNFRLFGLLPGTYYISAVPRWRDPVTEENQETESRYAPTYFPGTVDLGHARSVTVALGSEVSGITIGLSPIRTLRLRGTVVDSSGRPAAAARVTAVRREAGNAFITAADGRSSIDGTFELSDLPPGSYSVQAWVRGAADSPPEFGATLVQAAGTDTEGVVVRTSTGGTLRGRLVLRGDAGHPPFKPSLVEITARPIAQDVRVPVGSSARARARDDWTFELRGLSGARVLHIAGAPAPWALEAIRLHGADVTDEPIDLKPGTATDGLEILLTTRATEIEGTVERPQGDRTPTTVVVFPVDRSHWAANNRRVQIRRATADGRFGIRGLPPGDYLAIALPFMWQGEWTDPDFLERASAAATRVRLGPAERKAVHLKVAAIAQ